MVNFTSINDITFSAMERGASMFGRATFVMDRGYDDSKMFLKLDALKQDYVIRLTSKRRLFFLGKWISATQLRNQRKGKIRTPLLFRGKCHDAYLSHVKVQITASRKDIYLVLVYGIKEYPMMLATNKEIRSKEDVIKKASVAYCRMQKKASGYVSGGSKPPMGLIKVPLILTLPILNFQKSGRLVL